MRRHNLLHDGQPQPRPAGLSRIERLKNRRHFGRDATSRILHLHLHGSPVPWPASVSVPPGCTASSAFCTRSTIARRNVEV